MRPEQLENVAVKQEDRELAAPIARDAAADAVKLVRQSPTDWNLGIEFEAMQWPETWARCSC